MRRFAAYFTLFSLLFAGAAVATECPEGALGVSRTIVVDPAEHARLGSFQYAESLPLRDHEIVLTFDDGPLPPYTGRILDTLASECVKATFFMVGRMVRTYPSIVHRVYSEGHTVANHSQNHPLKFHKMKVEQAAKEIEDGFASLHQVLGEGTAVAPFFRVPGLLRQSSVEQYLAAHNYMTWSVDFLADDWTHIKSDEVTRRALERIEARGRGILLLHDIQPATALALSDILRELKSRGFKIVHVVPASDGHPKTATLPEQWAARLGAAHKVWPRTLVNEAELAGPTLSAPNPANFGIETFGGRTRVALAQTFERAHAQDGDTAADAVLWPQQVAYTASSEVAVLPVPAAHNFRYRRPFRPVGAEKRKPPSRTAESGSSSKHPASQGGKSSAPPAKGKDPQTTGSIFSLLQPGKSRPAGHQLSAPRPPTDITPPISR
ncbi:MAG: polysaccharide deacetylase family protein [Xanthobacteraceae bacterium]